MSATTIAFICLGALVAAGIAVYVTWDNLRKPFPFMEEEEQTPDYACMEHEYNQGNKCIFQCSKCKKIENYRKG